MQLASAFSGLLVGPVVQRMKDQRAAAVGVSLLLSAALLGLMLSRPGRCCGWPASVSARAPASSSA
jgi:CP family cyanate transporter-like MFS transporter